MGCQLIVSYMDVRSACWSCGRFIKESTCRDENHHDPSNYYGVRTESFYTCVKCGEQPGLPRVVEIGTRYIRVDTPFEGLL